MRQLITHRILSIIDEAVNTGKSLHDLSRDLNSMMPYLIDSEIENLKSLWIEGNQATPCFNKNVIDAQKINRIFYNDIKDVFGKEVDYLRYIRPEKRSDEEKLRMLYCIPVDKPLNIDEK